MQMNPGQEDTVNESKLRLFRESRSGDRVMVTPNGAVKIERETCTTNPHIPARRWYLTARPKDAAAYAARKVASGEWEEVA